MALNLSSSRGFLPTILILTSLANIDVSYGRVCDGGKVGIPLHCPGPDDNQNLSECCYDGGARCCVFSDRLNQQLVMVVALSVIVTCIALTVMIVVCCFCPRCLLYDTCRANYTRGEIIAYTKEEEMALNSAMPPEDHNEKSFYSPCAVRIKPLAEV